VQDVSAEKIAEAVVNTWVVRFGAPKTITTDQDTQFESQIFEALGNLLGYIRTKTRAYHPATNGIIKRWLIKSCNMLSRIKKLVTRITNSFIRVTQQRRRRYKSYSSKINKWYYATTTGRIFFQRGLYTGTPHFFITFPRTHAKRQVHVYDSPQQKENVHTWNLI